MFLTPLQEDIMLSEGSVHLHEECFLDIVIYTVAVKL